MRNLVGCPCLPSWNAAFPRVRTRRSSRLPPMTCLHKGNHLLFGRASLLRFHCSLLAHTLFTKRLFSLPHGNRGLPLSGDDHLAQVRLAEVRLVETSPTEAASTE